ASMAQPHRKSSALGRRHVSWGLLFLLPWFIGLIVFQALPILFTLFLSFTDYNGNAAFEWGAFHFVGLDNFARLFSDPIALPSMGVTLKFALIGIPLGLIVPLAFALLVNSKHLIGSTVFRTLYFLPTVIPVVAGTIVFGGVLNAQS